MCLQFDFSFQIFNFFQSGIRSFSFFAISRCLMAKTIFKYFKTKYITFLLDLIHSTAKFLQFFLRFCKGCQPQAHALSPPKQYFPNLRPNMNFLSPKLNPFEIDHFFKNSRPHTHNIKSLTRSSSLCYCS